MTADVEMEPVNAWEYAYIPLSDPVEIAMFKTKTPVHSHSSEPVLAS